MEELAAYADDNYLAKEDAALEKALIKFGRKASQLSKIF
jgi:hypothetical protein